MRNLLLLEIVITLAAGVTGGFVLLLALAVARVCGWPVSYAYIAGAGAALFAWLVWTSRAADILESMSTPTRRKPPTQDTTPNEINLRIHSGDAYPEGVFLDRLPISADTLAALARRALEGQSLTTSGITGAGIDRRTWETLRDRFIAAGLLAWRGGVRAHGCEVTGRGLRVFSRLAGDTPPTPPPARLY